MSDLIRFLRDVGGHQMAVEIDHGVHRSIYFGQPGSGTYHFRLVTWPGSLAIDGDCGSYTFSRTRDMFEFFRNTDGDNEINCQYWHEKMQAEDKSSPAKVFSHDRLKQAAKSHFDNWEGPFGEAEKIWAQVEREVLHAYSEAEAYALIRDFESSGGHEFQDFESDLKDYNFGFIWCLRAIVWGIKRYDQLKEGRTQADHDRHVLAGAR